MNQIRPWLVHDQVIGVVVPLSVQRVRKRGYGHAVGLEPDNAATALLASVQITGVVETEAVGKIYIGEVLAGLASFRVVPHNATARNVAEQQGLAVPDRTFGGAAVGSGNQFKIPTHARYLLSFRWISLQRLCR